MSRTSWGLLRCSVCGTGVTVGEPPGRQAYESSPRPRLSGAARPVLALFDRTRLGLLGPPRGSLLDVGAGRGRFVAAARRAGWASTGIEPSARGVEAARTVYEVELARVSVAEASGTYEAVTMWHVLEHLEDPSTALARVASLLAPGGLLLVGVPNLDSVQARIGRDRWFHLDLPRHRSHFTRVGIRCLLERSGLAVETVATSTSADSLPMSLRYRRGRRGRGGLRTTGLVLLGAPLTGAFGRLTDGDLLHAVGRR